MRTALALTLAALVGGCTHVRPAPLDAPAGRAEVNRRAAEATAILTFADGRRVEARSARVDADSVTWLDPDGRGGQAAPTGRLVSVRFVDRGRGALEGAGLGLAVGAGVGLALGALASVVDGGAGFVLLTPAEGIALSAAGFGIVGAGVGLVGGVDRGSQTVYRPAPGSAPPDRGR